MLKGISSWMTSIIQANEIYFNNMDNGFLKREGGHEGGPSVISPLVIP